MHPDAVDARVVQIAPVAQEADLYYWKLSAQGPGERDRILMEQKKTKNKKMKGAGAEQQTNIQKTGRDRQKFRHLKE